LTAKLSCCPSARCSSAVRVWLRQKKEQYSVSRQQTSTVGDMSELEQPMSLEEMCLKLHAFLLRPASQKLVRDSISLASAQGHSVSQRLSVAMAFTFAGIARFSSAT